MNTFTYLLKYYLFPIFKWGLSEAKKKDFNISLLYETAKRNKKQLAKKLAVYSYKRTKLLLKDWDNKVMESSKTIDGYAGTIDDSEEYGGGATTLKYIGQEIPQIPYKVFQYNQRNNNYGSTVLCFGYGNLGESSDNLGFKWSDELLKELDTGFINSKEYDSSVGGYFSEGRRVVNSMLDTQGYEYDTYEVPSKSSYARQVLDLGYSITMGIRITDKILKGMKDGRLSVSEATGGNKKYNHLVRIKKNKQGTVDMWIDNYNGILKFNTVEIEDLKVLAENGRLMNTSYFVVPKGKTLKNIIAGKDTTIKSDYEKFLERGFIETPQPDRILNERLFGTLMQRILIKKEK